MAHYQYTQEENVAFTSCKRKVVKLLKPANEATERGVVQRGGGGCQGLPLERGVKITVTKPDKLSSESPELSQSRSLTRTELHTVHPVGQNTKKKPSLYRVQDSWQANEN